MRVHSGSEVIDALLEGGFEPEVLTTIYGPSGSGKTNIVMVALMAQLKAGKKVIYVDTEASFSAARACQIWDEFPMYAKQIMFLRPTTFDEQKEAFALLRDMIADDKNEQSIGMVVVDSIAMLYRLEIGVTTDIHTTNRELGMQLGQLTEIARKKKIPVLITNQVYADFENKNAVKLVGGDLLKYSSKCLIELRKFKDGLRTATIVKHRSQPEGKSVAFRVVQTGMEQVALGEAKPVENAYEQ